MTRVAAVFTVVAYASAQTFETGDNSTVKGCSSHCSLKDGDLTCWNSTLHFFEQVLLAQVRHYIAVQINIDQWHQRHDEPYHRNFTIVRQEAIQDFDKSLEDEDVINRTTVLTIVNALIDRVEEKSEMHMGRTPHFRCPLPCEYRANLWRYLFIASTIINIGLALAVIPFIRTVIKSDTIEPLIK